MDREEALKVLQVHKRKILKNVYDKDALVAQAIFTLYANFEYPDFSHRKISELIKYISKYDCQRT